MSTQRVLLRPLAVHGILMDFGISNSALVAKPLTCCMCLVQGREAFYPCASVFLLCVFVSSLFLDRSCLLACVHSALYDI